LLNWQFFLIYYILY